ncbi:hypothetical protein O0L34_g19563 [Tuta absoluta]|nr:hypothetical protein O0L34_g19563 [Tuta absoluta]
MEDEAGEDPATASQRGSEREVPPDTFLPSPSPTPAPDPATPSRGSLGSKRSGGSRGSRNRGSIRSNVDKIEENITEAVSKLVPQGNSISSHVDELTHSVQQIAGKLDDPAQLQHDIRNITRMSKVLTAEANALRNSIRGLSKDIQRSRDDICRCEDVNFPYHLFLIEMIVNKIHMKCECFELNSNNLVISATFLGKQPIILYDASYGPLNDFNKLNVGKSTLFAMTYDKICAITEFEILLQITKEPSCTSCVTKIAETRMDYTKEFLKLREELCRKWCEEKPKDNIICTTSTPLSKSMFYLSCGDKCNLESIGVIEMSVRMSFLGKEINTAFCASPSNKGTSVLKKEDNGISMYSCQKVEMDDQGKILLDEDDYVKKQNCYPSKRTASPTSELSRPYSSRSRYNYDCPNSTSGGPKFDEIFTKMNENELKIRVPKASRVEKNPRYEKIQELCTCEDMPGGHDADDAGGEQIQFQLPRELCAPDKTHNNYTSNLKYTYTGCDKTCESRDRKVVNVTPTNCPISSAINMEKVVHPQKDVFILKIGKKMETKDKKTDLEIELVTPKVQNDKLISSDTGQQYSSTTIKSKKGKDKKGKGKEGAKGKGKGKAKGKKKGVTAAATKSRDMSHGRAAVSNTKEPKYTSRRSRDMSHEGTAVSNTKEPKYTSRRSRDMSHEGAAVSNTKEPKYTSRRSRDMSHVGAAESNTKEPKYNSRVGLDMSHRKGAIHRTSKTRNSAMWGRDISPDGAKYRTKKPRFISRKGREMSPGRPAIYRIEEAQYVARSGRNISDDKATIYCMEEQQHITQRSCDMLHGAYLCEAGARSTAGAPHCFTSAGVTSCDIPPPATRCVVSTAARAR